SVRYVEVNVTHNLVALPNDVHFLWRLNEIGAARTEIERDDARFPAARGTVVQGEARRIQIIGLLQPVLRELREIRIVQIRISPRRLVITAIWPAIGIVADNFD